MREPRKPPFWPGRKMPGLAMIGSGRTAALNGTWELGLSILTIEPNVGQSVGWTARMFVPP